MNLYIFQKQNKKRIQDKVHLQKFIQFKIYVHVKNKIFKNQNKKKYIEKIHAMKVYNKQHLKHQNIILKSLMERNILKNNTSPFIVTLYYAFQAKQNLYLITELVFGGDLYRHLQKFQKFDEEKVTFYASQIVMALECLHQQNIIYRDLKLENILLEIDGYIKLTDFGLSKDQIKNNDLTYTFCGTPEYMAPEQINNNGHNKMCDFWQLGILIYELLCGKTPFWSSENRYKKDQIYINILNGKYQFPHHLSENAKNIIYFLLQTDFKKRLGYNGFQEIKNHPFFQNIDWDLIYKKQIKAPYIPPMRGPIDLQNFNPVFCYYIYFYLFKFFNLIVYYTLFKFFFCLKQDKIFLYIYFLIRNIQKITNMKFKMKLLLKILMMNIIKDFLILKVRIQRYEFHFFLNYYINLISFYFIFKENYKQYILNKIELVIKIYIYIIQNIPILFPNSAIYKKKKYKQYKKYKKKENILNKKIQIYIIQLKQKQ
ncbi:protein kinase, putative [Ichthyophthirius multifiliis]|uniref:Protein kinase, putative n=1 Tax=Ichthyophthirius multifiliis TaxID=5932 RepID=G0QU78_ICHMU|nr:protein kinase, putative [Ichthyophthirius multifiliis]EGR31215.1 protein kinase, putative [Ichthyophthirius multifiliis]|eukprot:XP_004034701.1 protein kinase, putative [Ichthyophthirius multifiliis]